MKNLIRLLFFFVSFNLICQENTSFSDSGFISYNSDDITMEIYLVKNIEELFEINSDKKPIIITEVRLHEPISIFIVYKLSSDIMIELKYDSKLRMPNNILSELWSNSNIGNGMFKNGTWYRSESYETLYFGETDDIGAYQFHIEIYINNQLWHTFVLEFNLLVNII